MSAALQADLISFHEDICVRVSVRVRVRVRVRVIALF